MDRKIWATSPDGTLEFVSLTKEYLEESYDMIMEYYFKEETMSKLSGLYKNPVAMKEVVEMFKLTAYDGISIAIVDKATGRLAGVAFQKLDVKEEEDLYFTDFTKSFTQEESKAFVRLEEEAWTNMNLFDKLGINCNVELDFCVVLPEFRSRGILSTVLEIVIEMVTLIRQGEDVRNRIDDKVDLGELPKPEALFSTCTSPYTAKVMKKYGFEEVGRKKYTQSCDKEIMYMVMPLDDIDMSKLKTME